MEKGKRSSLTTFFIIIGAVVSVGAILVMLYTFFKKYFKISLECNDDSDDTECFDDEDFGDEDGSYEPICCCEDHNEEDSAAATDESTTEEVAF